MSEGVHRIDVLSELLTQVAKRSALVLWCHISNDVLELEIPLAKNAITCVSWDDDDKAWFLFGGTERAKHRYLRGGAYTVRIVGGIPLVAGRPNDGVDIDAVGQVLRYGNVPLRLPIAQRQYADDEKKGARRRKRVKLTHQQYKLLASKEAKSQVERCEYCLGYFPLTDIDFHKSNMGDGCSPSDIREHQFDARNLGGVGALQIEGKGPNLRQVRFCGLRLYAVDSGASAKNGNKSDSNMCFYLSCSVATNDGLVGEQKTRISAPPARQECAITLKEALQDDCRRDVVHSNLDGTQMEMMVQELGSGRTAGHFMRHAFCRHQDNALCVIRTNPARGGFGDVTVYRKRNADESKTSVTMLLYTQYGKPTTAGEIGHYTRLFGISTASFGVIASLGSLLQFLNAGVKACVGLDPLVGAEYMTAAQVDSLIERTTRREQELNAERRRERDRSDSGARGRQEKTAAGPDIIRAPSGGRLGSNRDDAHPSEQQFLDEFAALTLEDSAPESDGRVVYRQSTNWEDVIKLLRKFAVDWKIANDDEERAFLGTESTVKYPTWWDSGCIYFMLNDYISIVLEDVFAYNRNNDRDPYMGLSRRGNIPSIPILSLQQAVDEKQGNIGEWERGELQAFICCDNRHYVTVLSGRLAERMRQDNGWILEGDQTLDSEDSTMATEIRGRYSGAHVPLVRNGGDCGPCAAIIAIEAMLYLVPTGRHAPDVRATRQELADRLTQREQERERTSWVGWGGSKN